MVIQTAAAGDLLNVEAVRRDFPILARRVRHKPLVYLDNAATAQKPRSVIAAVSRYYEEENANIHRGVHRLSQEATFAYERARGRIAQFLNAESSEEIVFVRGTTEGINLVASSFGRTRIEAGDEVLVTHMEHHSNIVPWQIACRERQATLKVAPIDDAGRLDMDAFEDLLSERTRLVAVAHASNVLGTINPVAEIARLAHGRGAVLLVDGAQGAPHLPVDVRALDCDFYLFSGHKLCGPTGIGVLYGRRALLESMPPWEGGGSMIESVSFEKTTFADPPTRFEAGTPNIAGAIGLEAAVDYVNDVGPERIDQYEQGLLAYATEKLTEVEGLRIFGTSDEKVAVISFELEGVHPHDTGTILDLEGVAIRTGHHCAQPLMSHFGVPAMARASLAFYNTREEVDVLAGALASVRSVLA
ncbi:MAG: cysteine desulfurase [Gemmatimonadetes bacterium]|nr:cysteine desulfurase [Gemmatimonadota bacterium]